MHFSLLCDTNVTKTLENRLICANNHTRKHGYILYSYPFFRCLLNDEVLFFNNFTIYV